MTLEPRLDPDEIEYFKTLMEQKPENTKMVEWGSGGSTVFFLPYFVNGSLVSIEHNPEWFGKVVDELNANYVQSPALKNLTYIHVEPEYVGHPVDLRFYGYGVPFEENPCFLKKYINPEGELVKIWDADIYFVDGIARGAILATILLKAEKPDASVYIHDYYGPEQRGEWYGWASSLYRKVEKVGSTLARLWL